MEFYRDMYIGPEIKHPGNIKWRLQHNAGGLSLYVITLCEDVPGQLQFFPATYLRQDHLRRHCPMVIGAAEGREAAIRLVTAMFEECYAKTGGADLLPFLAKRDARLAERISAGK